MTDRGYRGTIVYPDYCSGKWVYKGKSDGWFKFTEKITKHADICVSPVRVKVKRKDAKLRVVWTEPKSGDSARMLAKRI